MGRGFNYSRAWFLAQRKNFPLGPFMLSLDLFPPSADLWAPLEQQFSARWGVKEVKASFWSQEGFELVAGELQWGPGS